MENRGPVVASVAERHRRRSIMMGWAATDRMIFPVHQAMHVNFPAKRIQINHIHVMKVEWRVRSVRVAFDEFLSLSFRFLS